jgi:hypothetical protein
MCCNTTPVSYGTEKADMKNIVSHLETNPSQHAFGDQ